MKKVADVENGKGAKPLKEKKLKVDYRVSYTARSVAHMNAREEEKKCLLEILNLKVPACRQRSGGWRRAG